MIEIKTNNAIKACDEALKFLRRKVSDLDKKLETVKKESANAKKETSIWYKDIELFTYEDIQDLYGNGVIGEKKFDSLVKELEDKLSGNDKKDEIEILEYEIKFLNYFINETVGTKESELQKLGLSDDEILKMRYKGVL